MIEDLLFIAKVLLNQIETSTSFTKKEREQILNTVRKVIFILIIEDNRDKLKTRIS